MVFFDGLMGFNGILWWFNGIYWDFMVECDFMVVQWDLIAFYGGFNVI